MPPWLSLLDIDPEASPRGDRYQSMITAVADVETDRSRYTIDYGEGLPAIVVDVEDDPFVAARQPAGQHCSQGRPAQGEAPSGAPDLESLQPALLRCIQPGE